MSATILQFPQAARASTAPPAGARPLALAPTTSGARALSPAQELYMDGYLERAISDAGNMMLDAVTPQAQDYWLKVLRRLHGLRLDRQLARMKR